MRAHLVWCSLVLACGGSDSSIADVNGGTPPGSGTENDGGSTGTPATPPAPTCTGKEKLGGDLDWTIPHAGRDRVARVHVPASYDPAKGIPVVLNFHGYTSNGRQQAAYSAMNAKADAAGFVAVHGEGVASSWNAGVCCGQAQNQSIDDVGFVNALLDELSSKLCVDTKRVFSTGLSNGGFLSYRLACENAGRIAAIAPVAGGMGVTACTPSRAVSVLHFHGTSDGVVPYGGSPALGFPPVADTIAGWVARDQCTGAERVSFENGDVRCTTRDACANGAEVTLCTITGGGHTWPGAIAVPSLGPTTQDIAATDALWDFFVKHPL
jgi:polyhydroxybutyrate depolymerase